MVKVITYGTYDFLHEGHIRLLKRAKELGDYLIVGITADGFDKARGKINVQQSLMERIEAVKKTGLANQIIIEEYDGQKIDDIKKYDVDIFTVGSDWIGKFDYLNEFCKVIYLDRTKGISSSEIRANKQIIRIGLVGETSILTKFKNECKYVNGVSISGIHTESKVELDDELNQLADSNLTLDELLNISDALYIASHPQKHYSQIKLALEKGKHILCESPIALNPNQFETLIQLAIEKKLVLMDGIKTAYSLAFNRLILLIKSGIIGDVISIDTTCTSLIDIGPNGEYLKPHTWNTICWWGPTAILPILDIFGTKFKSLQLSTKFLKDHTEFDLFTKGLSVPENG